MACSKIKVCHNTRCKNQGATLVIQDIEELVQGGCSVQKSGCLGKCGLGPNVELEIDGIPEVYSGLSTFDKTLETITDTALIEVPTDVARIGQLKYEARRMTDPDLRLVLLGRCIEEIDKEKESPFHSKLKADVLVMRSKDMVRKHPQKALADAEEASKLAPRWAQALLSLSAAAEAMGCPSRGLEAAQEALKTGKCFDKLDVKNIISRLLPLSKQEKEDPDKYKKSFGVQSKLSEVALVKAPKEREYSSNIFVKFGGRPKFKDLAYKVHEAMFLHPAVSYFFPPTMDNTRITERNVDFLVGAFGGPKYKGPDMIITHEFLRISNEQYEVMMDCYRTAIAEMKIHEMFAIPIFRQLEGMRTSIVYSKNRPGPLARKLDGHLEHHKAARKREKEKNKKEQEKAATAAAAKAAAAAAAAAETVKTKPTPQVKVPTDQLPPSAVEKMYGVDETLKPGPISEASTEFRSSGDADCGSSHEKVGQAAAIEETTETSGERCPMSGAEGTCPFLAMLGGSPKQASLLQSLKDGRVLLKDPQAVPASPSFGVVSM